MGRKPAGRSSRRGEGLGDVARAGRRGGRRRRVVLLVLVLGLLLGGAAVVVSYVVVPRAQVIEKLEELTGCRVSAGRIRLSADLSGLVIKDLLLEVPGVGGEAGEVLAVDRVEIAISRRSLLGGSVRPTRVRLFGPRIRFSVDESGVVNISALAGARQRADEGDTGPSGVSPSGAPGLLPQGVSISLSLLPAIELLGGTVELCEHQSGDTGSFVVLERLRVGGTIRPVVSEQRAEIDLYEISKRPGSQAVVRDGLRITGEIDAAGNRLTANLTQIDLAEVDRLNPPGFIREVWDRLRMSGQITRARLLIGPSEGVVVELRLDGVALTLPIDPASGLDGDGEVAPLRMSDVGGDIAFSTGGLRADLEGALNDFRARVVLSLGGYSASAPFDLNIRTTEPFRIAERPDLLPYAPEVVKEISARFGGPTGMVSAAVVVNRGAGVDGRASEIVTNGYLRIREGTGAFEHFPYPLQEVEAFIRFEPGMVRLESVTALGPTGARISAVGGIGPPGNEAGVDLEITAVGVPLDDVLRRTLASNGLDLMPVLFDEGGYARLRDAGLVQTRSERDEAALALNEAERSLDALLAVPGPGRESEIERARRGVDELSARVDRAVFELGGEASLRIDIKRPVGADQSYRTDVVVRIAEAGLLPAEFPYPIVGRRLGIYIRDNDARVYETAFKTPTGGTGSLSGRVAFQLPDGDREAVIEPVVSIAARDVPIDPLLLFALPRGGFGGDEGAGVASFPEALSRLGLSGVVSCDAMVSNAGVEGDSSRLAVRASIGIESLRADPLGDVVTGGSALLDDVSARITLDDRSFSVDRFEGRSGAGVVGVTGRGMLGGEGEDGGTRLSLEVRAVDLDVSKRLERLIVAFVPGVAPEFAGLRAEHLPEGLVGLDAAVSLDGAEVDYRVSIGSLRDAAFDVFGKRVRIEDAGGGLVLTPQAVEFDGFSALLREEDGHGVGTRLHGGFALVDGVRSSLEAGIADGRFESPLLRRWLEFSSPDAAEALEAFELGGVFDAELRVDGERGDRGSLTGNVSPERIDVTWQGHGYSFGRTSGTIGIGETGGSIIALRGEAEDWSFHTRGVWTRGEGDAGLAVPNEPGAGLGLTLEVEAKGRGLPEDVMALLPPEARLALEDLAFGIEGAEGGFVLESARFVKEPAGDGRIFFDGTLRIAGGRITPAVELTGIDGLLQIVAEKPAGDPRAGVTIDAAAERMRVFGLGFGPARTRVLIGTAAGSGGGVDMPTIEVLGFNGIVTGRAAFPEFHSVEVSGTARDEPPHFTLDLRMTDLDFGGVLDDAALIEARDTGVPSGDAGPAMAGLRGTIDGSVFLTGLLDQPQTHRGRGELLAEGGDILNIPGVVGLVKLANLMPGPDEPFSVGSSAFSIRYDRVTFDRIVLEAPRSGTKLLGVGWMGLPGTELEMIFTPQAGRQVPVLSELFAGLRDEVARPYVTGTLRNPVVELRQLSRVRGMLGTIFATRPPGVPIPPAGSGGVVRPDRP